MIAFLGYVLPYGQMSLWGATVITNLLSAIPVFGHDLVELIWIEGTNELYSITFTSVLYNSHKETLTPIGQINWGKVRGINPLTSSDKERLLKIPLSYLARLAGIIDGDGYIAVVASDAIRQYASIFLRITLIHTELSMLIDIIKILGIGRITGPYRNNKGQDIVSLTINKTELQQVLFPLFFHHSIFFLTSVRITQYQKAIFLMESGLNKLSDLPNTLPISIYYFPFPVKGSDYLVLPFFRWWVIGFTIAEGSFLVKNNFDCCFQLKQRLNFELFVAFQLNFNTNRKITVENRRHAQFGVSSKKDIQTVINFFSNCEGYGLLGNKLIQYNMMHLKSTKRYGSINFPN